MAEHTDIDAALKAEQERLISRKQELEAEFSQIDRKLARINRYFDDEPQQPSRQSSPVSRIDNRHPRGFVQSTVLKTVAEHPQGLTRGELINLLKPQGIGEQSISNALGALTDAGKITAPQTRGGKYFSATAEVLTAPDQPSS
jgi:hypothetical protein